MNINRRLDYTVEHVARQTADMLNSYSRHHLRNIIRIGAFVGIVRGSQLLSKNFTDPLFSSAIPFSKGVEYAHIATGIAIANGASFVVNPIVGAIANVFNSDGLAKWKPFGEHSVSGFVVGSALGSGIALASDLIKTNYFSLDWINQQNSLTHHMLSHADKGAFYMVFGMAAGAVARHAYNWLLRASKEP